MSTRRRFRRIAVLMLIGGVLAGFLVWRMMWMPPAWYSAPNSTDPEIVKLADDVEYRLIEEAHRPRASAEQWTIRLREHQANAWLAARLQKWIAFEQDFDWPEYLGTPQLRFTNDGVDLACDVATPIGTRYIVIRVNPHLDGDQFALVITQAAIGRIAVGARVAERIASLLAPQQQAEFLESELGMNLIDATDEGAFFEPLTRLSDGRLVRLTAIALHEGAIDLTFVTIEDE